MNSLNSIILEGNLVRDPQHSMTPKGTPVCRFSVASNRFFQQEKEKKSEVSFFDVEVWSRSAELCSRILQKGRGVRVVGRLKQDRWLDESGKNHSKIKIIGEHIEFKAVKTPIESLEDENLLVGEGGIQELETLTTAETSVSSDEAEDIVIPTF